MDTARSIVILSPPTPDADAYVIKVILAMTGNRSRRREPYRIVAELREASNVAAAEIAGRGEAQLIVVGDLVAKIIAQTCRQAGLSAVYEALLDFEGDEIHVIDVPAHLVGRPFAESLLAFDRSTVIGMVGQRRDMRLNPPMDTIVGEDDRLLVIALDERSTRPAVRPADVREEALIEPRPGVRRPESTVLLGWNRRAPAIIRELDRYVVAGSLCVVLAGGSSVAHDVEELRSSIVNQSIQIRGGATTDARRLADVCAEGHDHVIVLSADDLDAQEADARTLMTLLHLREIASRCGHTFSITSEMVDLRNRALAEVTRADDFIVSDRIASLLLGQLAENVRLKAVFDDLFDADGSEIYLRPAREYVRPGAPVTFETLVAAASRRGETAIGVRRVSAGDATDATDRAHGVEINPPRGEPFVLGPADRLIVLAEEDTGAPEA